MDPTKRVTVRLATVEDIDTILRLSQGIYGGGDYIPIVIHQWMKDMTKYIFVAEYDDEVIGMQAAIIKTDGKSFVTQGLRIHPKHRGKRLSYQITDAVTIEMRRRFPQISTNLVLCDKYTASYNLYLKKGYSTFMEHKYYDVTVNNINPSHVDSIRSQGQSTSGLATLNENEILELLKNPKVLSLVGSHGIVLGEYRSPRRLENEADVIANEIARAGRMFVEPEGGENAGFPKSISWSVHAKRAQMDYLIAYIYTPNADTYKKHFLSHLKAAFSSPQHLREDRKLKMVFYEFSYSGSAFHGDRVIKDELARLRIDWDVTSIDGVLMECEI